MGGNWIQLVAVLLFVIIPILQAVFRKLQEVKGQREAQQTRERLEMERLRTGRDPRAEAAEARAEEARKAAELKARMDAIAEARRRQLEELRRRQQAERQRALDAQRARGPQQVQTRAPTTQPPTGGAPVPVPIPRRTPGPVAAPRRPSARQFEGMPVPVTPEADRPVSRRTTAVTPPKRPAIARTTESVLPKGGITLRDLRRVIVMREVLDPPVALRSPPGNES